MFALILGIIKLFPNISPQVHKQSRGRCAKQAKDACILISKRSILTITQSFTKKHCIKTYGKILYFLLSFLSASCNSKTNTVAPGKQNVCKYVVTIKCYGNKKTTSKNIFSLSGLCWLLCKIYCAVCRCLITFYNP